MGTNQAKCRSPHIDIALSYLRIFIVAMALTAIAVKPLRKEKGCAQENGCLRVTQLSLHPKLLPRAQKSITKYLRLKIK
jgi:hypothetical protein